LMCLTAIHLPRGRPNGGGSGESKEVVSLQFLYWRARWR
jgi:hypothetical protein